MATEQDKENRRSLISLLLNGAFTAGAMANGVLPDIAVAKAEVAYKLFQEKHKEDIERIVNEE